MKLTDDDRFLLEKVLIVNPELSLVKIGEAVGVSKSTMSRIKTAQTKSMNEHAYYRLMHYLKVYSSGSIEKIADYELNENHYKTMRIPKFDQSIIDSWDDVLTDEEMEEQAKGWREQEKINDSYKSKQDIFEENIFCNKYFMVMEERKESLQKAILDSQKRVMDRKIAQKNDEIISLKDELKAQKKFTKQLTNKLSRIHNISDPFPVPSPIGGE